MGENGSNSQTDKTILIADDNRIDRHLCEKYLQQAGYRLVMAENGKEALRLVKQHQPDLVLLDLMMPELDGFAVLRILRTMYDPEELPVVVVSGKNRNEDIRQAVELGANSYLTKPFEAELLAARVTEQLAAKNNRSRLPTPPPIDHPRTRLEIAGVILDGLEQLPSLPGVLNKIQKMMSNPRVNLKDVGKLISLDPTLTGKILRLVNSAYYGLNREVTSVQMAINYLGLETVRNLVLAATLHSAFLKERSHLSIYNRVWKHSMMVAVFAEVISRKFELGRPEELFTCGVLHNVGVLVELRFMEDSFVRIHRTAETEKIDLDEAELKLLGTTHFEISELLFEQWQLPAITRSIVKGFHDPESVDAMYYIYACMLNYAEFLVRQLGQEHGCNYGECRLNPKARAALKIDQQQEEALTGLFQQEMHAMVEFVNAIL